MTPTREEGGGGAQLDQTAQGEPRRNYEATALRWGSPRGSAE